LHGAIGTESGPIFGRFLRDSGQIGGLECRFEQGHPPVVRIAARNLECERGLERSERSSIALGSACVETARLETA